MELAELRPTLLDPKRVAHGDLWNMLERAADGVWHWQLDEGQLYWSRTLLALLGYTPETLDEAPNLLDLTHPEDRQSHRRIVEASFERGGRYSAEFRMLRRDGSVVWVSAWAIWHARPGERPHSMLGIVRDITERVATSEQLEASEARFRAFFDQVPAAVYIKDEDCRHLYGNEIAATFAGTDIESFIGVTAADLMDAETANALMDADRVAMRGQETVTYTGPLRLPGDTADRQIWDTKFPITGPGGERMLGGIGIDITELHETQKQLAIAQRLESVGLMASGVAHDFNNLLFAIAGNAELTLRNVAPEHRASVDSIIAATEHAAALCRQLLAIGGRGESSAELVHLGRLVSESTELLQMSLQAEHPLEVSIDCKNCTVHAEPGQLRQVLVNLVLNAKQASAPGQPIRVELGTVDLGPIAEIASHDVYSWLPEDANDGVYLAVEDRGRGMSSTQIERIFDPYYTETELGHGLGLATVFGAVKSAHGAIRVYSETGEGTRFEVYLPRASTGEADRGERSSLPVSEAFSPGLSRIMVIDDHAEIVGIVVAWLERLGVEVTPYTSSQLAVDVLRDRLTEFDAVLTDISMPGIGGIGVLEAIREQDPRKPVILASGFNDSAFQVEDDPYTWFLQKPYTLAELQRVLEEAATKAAA